MRNDVSKFEYVHIDNHAHCTLFLLHGTGGTKNDLLFFNELLGNTYNIVSLQGNCTEHGMPRFFKRISPGIFDQESIQTETKKLSTFITSWTKEYALSTQSCTFLGYSNGANMLLATLLLYPDTIRRAVLLHPMMPFPVDTSTIQLMDHTYMVTIGNSDRMIPSHLGIFVSDTLQQMHATVILKQYEGGHEITQKELTDIVTFLKKV